MSAAGWTDLPALALQVERTESRPEALLLVALWGARAGWTVEAQHPVGPYRVDLAIPEARIAVEVDGAVVHASAAAQDADHARQNALVAEGWTVLRFGARRIFVGVGIVAAQVAREARRRLPKATAKQPREARPVVEPLPLAATVEAGRGAIEALKHRPARIVPRPNGKAVA